MKIKNEKKNKINQVHLFWSWQVLSMECEDGLWRLVAFLSKSLNETERNYEIYDKEMLAIIRGLENWRHLLEGTHFKFEIWTDYKNLEYFMKAQKLNCRQAQWALYLSRFDFSEYIWPFTHLFNKKKFKKLLENENEIIKSTWQRTHPRN